MNLEVLPLRLDMTDARVWQGEQLLKLTPKAFAILHYLTERVGRLVTKDEVLRAVWADTVVTDGALVACIRELRKALQDEVRLPRYIETVHRRGYRFIGTVVSSNTAESRSQQSEPKSSPFSSQSSVLGTQSSVVVGRDAELVQLQQYWDKALRGKRQVVFVTGEPGIGKTSVVRAFLSQLGSQGWGPEPQSPFFQTASLKSPVPGVWVGHGQCIEQYGEGEPYLPVLEALGRLCHGAEGERLIALLNQHAPTWLVQMPALLSVTDHEALQRRTQSAVRKRVLQELIEAMEAISAERPLVLALEDLHWSDPSTVDFLAMLARRSEPARLLVLGTYRPVEVITREHPLKAIKTELQLHEQCQELPLERWSEAQVKEYLRARLGVPSPLKGESQGEGDVSTFWCKPVRLIRQRTEGNPLFVAAMVDELMTRGLLGQTEQGWELQEAPAAGEDWIPDTIRQLVTLQSGRVPLAAQQVLEAASVAGLEFSAAAVAAALTTEIMGIERQCEQLADRQYFLRRVGTEEWPDGTLAARYGFSHAVYQQLWHERVSPTQMQQYHLRIGERKERGYGERSGDIAGELAMHFEQGRDYRKAIQYLQLGGQNAIRRSAHPEAVHLIAKGLHLLETFPETPERARQELVLQIALGAPLIATRGYASAEVGKAYARARELCQQMQETAQVFPVLTGLRLFYTVRAEHQTARVLGEQMFRLAENAQDPAFLLEAHHALGVVSFSQGKFSVAREHLQRGAACYDPQQHSALAFRHGADSGVVCRAYESCVLWLLGYPDLAIERCDEALQLAREQAHPFSLAHAFHLAAMLHQFRREDRTAQVQAEAAITLSIDQGFSVWAAAAAITRGWSMTEQGQWREGLAEILQGQTAYRATGAEYQRTYVLMLLAEMYRKEGETEEGLSALAEALTLVKKTEERCYEAELYRLKGELILQKQQKVESEKLKVPSPQPLISNPQAEAEECFLKAIDIARQQQAKSWELRAVMSLVRLRQQQAVQPGSRTTQHASRVRRDEARQMLTAVYNWFTEGFDTKDLREAKALLLEPDQ